jgi:hypothetical protein
MRPRHVKTLSLITIIALAAAGAAACGTQPAEPPGGSAPAPGGSAAAARTASVPPAASAGGSTPTSASPPSDVTGPATLTEADNGATVRLAPGQRVIVVLSSQGMLSWHVPAARGASVRRLGASGGYPARRPARATFSATRRGSATLNAVNDAQCLHAQPACMIPQQAWQVTIVVS